MATTALTADTFEKTVLDHEIVVVDFWADWCGPCKRFAPVFEGASEDGVNEGIFFGKVDTEAEQALAAAANITSIPMLMAFKDGVLVYGEAGALPAGDFAQLLQKIRELDMAPIKEKMAADKAAAESTGAAADDSDA